MRLPANPEPLDSLGESTGLGSGELRSTISVLGTSRPENQSRGRVMPIADPSADLGVPSTFDTNQSEELFIRKRPDFVILSQDMAPSCEQPLI